MKMTLKRDVFAPKFTLGTLTCGSFTFQTLEDKVREIDGVPVEKWKVYGETAIPRGTYKVIVNMSNRFKKKLPLLLDVPGFKGIRIHSGNTEADTEGCILVGTERRNGKIMNSRYAMMILNDTLMTALGRGENITIEIS